MVPPSKQMSADPALSRNFLFQLGFPFWGCRAAIGTILAFLVFWDSHDVYSFLAESCLYNIAHLSNKFSRARGWRTFRRFFSGCMRGARLWRSGRATLELSFR
jgi:hypothetical protein